MGQVAVHLCTMFKLWAMENDILQAPVPVYNSTASLTGASTSWSQESSSGIGDVVVDHLIAKNDGTVIAGTHGNGVFSAGNLK